MDNNLKDLSKEKSSNSLKEKEENEKISEKKEYIKDSSFFDNIGFNKIYELKVYNGNLNELEFNQENKNKEKDLDNILSSVLSYLNKEILHNFLNEDLIDAIEKSLDDPKDNHKLSDISDNDNETNYSQNNISNDNDIFNNLSNMNINFHFYPKNINSIYNSISFLPKINKKEEEKNANNANNNFVKNIINKEENNKDIKKLVDYFGSNDPLDVPAFIPKKYKSLKINRKSNKTEDNDISNLDKSNKKENNKKSDKKEKQSKKTLEIREGDWTCESCYNLNFSFRKRCNRCGVIKDFWKSKNNLSLKNNDNFPDYQNLKQMNSYLGNNSNNYFQFLKNIDLSNIPLFSPNTSDYS